jgi:WD40 repeat protein
MKAVRDVDSMEKKSNMNGTVSPNGRTALLSSGNTHYLLSMPEGKAEGIDFPGNIRVPSISRDSSCSFTPDGRSVVWANYGWHLRYDIPSKKFTSVFTNGSDITIAISPDGKRFASASDRGDLVLNAGGTSNRISLYDASTLVRIKEMTANSLAQQDTCCVTHDGRYLITGGTSEKFIRIWDLKYGLLTQRLPTGDLTGCADIQLSPDNKTIAVMKGSALFCFSTVDCGLWRKNHSAVTSGMLASRFRKKWLSR